MVLEPTSHEIFAGGFPPETMHSSSTSSPAEAVTVLWSPCLCCPFTRCTTTVEGRSRTTSCAPCEVSASFAVKLLGVTWFEQGYFENYAEK